MDMLSEYTVGYHNMETFDDLPIALLVWRTICLPEKK